MKKILKLKLFKRTTLSYRRSDIHSNAMSEKKYFSQLPNLIDDADLTPVEFRVYVHLLRVCGADGVSTQGTRLLSEWCGISVSGIVKAKQQLKKKGLIKIRKIKTPNGKADEIKLADIWNMNARIYDKDLQIEIPTNPNALQRTALKAAERFLDLKSQNRNTLLPEDFKLTKKLRDWAAEYVPDADVEFEFDQFVDVNLGSGNKSRNWESFFKKWLKDAAIYKS